MFAFERLSRRLHLCVPPLAAALCLSLLSNAVHAQSAVTYSYDGGGRLIGVNDGIGTKSNYVFDKADNRSNVTTQLQFSASWEAESLPHVIGYADGNGWAANVTISRTF